jgi:hypothetical protein
LPIGPATMPPRGVTHGPNLPFAGKRRQDSSGRQKKQLLQEKRKQHGSAREGDEDELSSAEAAAEFHRVAMQRVADAARSRGPGERPITCCVRLDMRALGGAQVFIRLVAVEVADSHAAGPAPAHRAGTRVCGRRRGRGSARRTHCRRRLGSRLGARVSWGGGPGPAGSSGSGRDRCRKRRAPRFAGAGGRGAAVPARASGG